MVAPGYWIPNVHAKELPSSRTMHLEMSREESAIVEVVIPEAEIGLARFWGLRNGGATHPQHDLLHIKSIDVSYEYPKEFEGNTLPHYQDNCVKLTLNYGMWQIPNQGYESILENIGMVYTLPINGLYWSMPNNHNAPNFSDPLWGSNDMQLRRGNLRITRNYTGRTNSPTHIHAYHNTLNANPLTLLEWEISLPPETGLFTVGSFSRQRTQDFSDSDPSAKIDLYSFAYSIEWIAGGWNTLHHPYSGDLRPLFDRSGNRMSFFPKETWNLAPLLE